MSKREFVEDKIYLQTPDGNIWEYEPLLAKQKGVEKVVPNPSKKEEVSTEETDTENQ